MINRSQIIDYLLTIFLIALGILFYFLPLYSIVVTGQQYGTDDFLGIFNFNAFNIFIDKFNSESVGTPNPLEQIVFNGDWIRVGITLHLMGIFLIIFELFYYLLNKNILVRKAILILCLIMFMLNLTLVNIFGFIVPIHDSLNNLHSSFTVNYNIYLESGFYISIIIIFLILIYLIKIHLFDLRRDLIFLNLHTDLNEVSYGLYKDKHYSEAVFEAVKSLNNFIKRKAEIHKEDLAGAMAGAFNEQNPIIKLNPLETQSDIDEQKGFKFIYMGVMTGIRNIVAHENVEIDSETAKLYLNLVNFLYKKVENAIKQE